MKKEELYNTKLIIPNDKISRIVQEHLQRLGFYWPFGNSFVNNLEFLFIESNNRLLWVNSLEKFNFYANYKEIKIADLNIEIDWCISSRNTTSEQRKIYQNYRKYTIIDWEKDESQFRGNFNNIGNSHPKPFGILLTFEEFETLFINKTMKNDIQQQYSLTKDQLILLHNKFNCHKWRTVIDLILTGTQWYLGETLIKIAPCHIETLIKEGTAEQKKAVEALGIKLDSEFVYIKDFPIICSKEDSYLITRRNIGKNAGKAFQLSSGFNWEIKTDNLGDLCLIPTKK